MCKQRYFISAASYIHKYHFEKLECQSHSHTLQVCQSKVVPAEILKSLGLFINASQVKESEGNFKKQVRKQDEDKSSILRQTPYFTELGIFVNDRQLCGHLA